MKLINWLQSHKKPLQPQEEKVLKSDEIFLDTIESLKETIRIQNETINSLIAKPQANEKVIEHPFNEQLKDKIEQLTNEKEILDAFKNKGISNCQYEKIENGQSLSNIEVDKPYEYWKLFLVLGLFFITIEIALLRFMK